MAPPCAPVTVTHLTVSLGHKAVLCRARPWTPHRLLPGLSPSPWGSSLKPGAHRTGWRPRVATSQKGALSGGSADIPASLLPPDSLATTGGQPVECLSRNLRCSSPKLRDRKPDLGLPQPGWPAGSFCLACLAGVRCLAGLVQPTPCSPECGGQPSGGPLKRGVPGG